MEKWVYKVLSVSTNFEQELSDMLTGHDPGAKAIESLLNSRSAEGWELVGFIPAKPATRTRQSPVGEWTDPANPWQQYAVFRKPSEFAAAQQKKETESERIEKKLERVRLRETQ